MNSHRNLASRHILLTQFTTLERCEILDAMDHADVSGLFLLSVIKPRCDCLRTDSLTLLMLCRLGILLRMYWQCVWMVVIFLAICSLESWRELKSQRQTSPANLADLPAEIILQIVDYLNPPPISQRRNDEDPKYNDPDWATFEFPDLHRSSSQRLRCCDAETEASDSSLVTQNLIVDDSLQLSAVSKRFREMIFLGGQMRRRQVEVCEWWIEETRRMPLEARSQYTFVLPIQLCLFVLAKPACCAI